MQLRSGKVTLALVPKSEPTWPTLESARKLRISTDDPIKFHHFCFEILHKVDDKKAKFFNRLYFLALVESFYCCGLNVLQTYYKVMMVTYEKMQTVVYEPDECPFDMVKYKRKLLDLMFRVASADQLDK